MILFPIVAAVVSGAFAAVVLKRWWDRRRLTEFAWGVALVMYALASLVVAAAVGGDWDPTLYRIFWLFGALLNVPWLALGSLALIATRPVKWPAVVAVVGLSVYGLVVTAVARVDRLVLASEDGIPRGRDVWRADPGMVDLARWYSIVGWVIVVGLALWTSRSVKGVRPPADRVRANWLIAVGVSIVAIGGFALSRIGRGSAFSVTLALGVVVMFVGFLLASRAPRYTVDDPGEQAT